MRTPFLLIALLLAGLLLAMPVSAGSVGDLVYNESVAGGIINPSVTYDTDAIVRPVVQGVTSVDNIDQSLTAFDGLAGVYPPAELRGQQFIPTKSQLSKIALNLTHIGSPTNGITISIQTNNESDYPSGAILASTTISASDISTSPSDYTYFDVPCIVTPGATYWIVFNPSSTSWNSSNFITWGRNASTTTSLYRAAGTSGVWTGHDTAFTFQYKEYFSKNTESVNITVNGNTTPMDTGDATGLLSGAIVDTVNGTYNWSGLSSNIQPQELSSVIYSATPTSRTDGFIGLNGWRYYNNTAGQYYINNVVSTTESQLTYKVNTIYPVKEITVSSVMYSGAAVNKEIQVSPDNSTWTTITTLNGAGGYFTNISTTSVVSGYNTFYVRLHHGNIGTADYVSGSILNISATLNMTAANATLNSLIVKNGNNNVNVSSNGQAVSASLDPSMKANVWLYVTELLAIKPIAISSVSRTALPIGSHLWFNDTSLNTPTAYNWTFQDGTYAETANGTKTYYIRGFRNISSCATNSAGTNCSYNIVRVI